MELFSWILPLVIISCNYILAVPIPQNGLAVVSQSPSTASTITVTTSSTRRTKKKPINQRKHKERSLYIATGAITG